MSESQTFTAPPFNLDDECLEALAHAAARATPEELTSWRADCQSELTAKCDWCKSHDKKCVSMEERAGCEQCSVSRRSCSFKNSLTLWRLKTWTREQLEQLLAYKKQREIDNKYIFSPARASEGSISAASARTRQSGRDSVQPSPQPRKRKRESLLESPAKHPRTVDPTPPPAIEFAPVTVFIDDVPHTAQTQAQLDDLVNDALQQHGVDLRREVEILKEQLIQMEEDRVRMKDRLAAFEKRGPPGEDFQTKIVELQSSVRQAKQELAAERAKSDEYQKLAQVAEERAREAKAALVAETAKVKEICLLQNDAEQLAEKELTAEKAKVNEYRSRAEAAEERAREAEGRNLDVSPRDVRRLDEVLGCLQTLRHQLDSSALPVLFDILQDISLAKNDQSCIDKGIQRWIPALWTLVLTQSSLTAETKEMVVKCLTEMSAKVIL